MGKVAYIHGKFPDPTDTFTVFEVLELEKKGLEMSSFSLLRVRNCFENPICSTIKENTIYAPLIPFRVFASHFYYVFKHIKSYLKCFNLIFRVKRGNPLNGLKVAFIFWNAVYFAKIIEKESIRHVHAPRASACATACMMISKLLGISFSFTAHAWDIFCETTLLEDKLKSAAFVVAISNYNKEYLVKNYDIVSHDKIKVIHCGVPVGDFYEERYVRNTGYMKILSLARFTEKKGQLYVLKIANLLREKGYEVKFILAGKCYNRKDVKVRHFLMRYAEENSLNDIVEFIDDPNRKQIIDLFRDGDIFLLPCCTTSSNDKDGIPVVLMEAMASRLPVVSTRVSGIPELISHGHTGLLTNEKDEAQLLDAIELLIQHEFLARRLGDNAVEKVTQDFNIASNSQKMSNLFSAHF